MFGRGSLIWPRATEIGIARAERDRAQPVAVGPHPLQAVLRALQHLQHLAVRMVLALRAGADAEQRRRTEIVEVEGVRAAVMGELGERERRLAPDRRAQLVELGAQPRVAHLRIGELHVAREQQLHVTDLEPGDDALEVDRRAGAVARVEAVERRLEQGAEELDVALGRVEVLARRRARHVVRLAIASAHTSSCVSTGRGSSARCSGTPAAASAGESRP